MKKSLSGFLDQPDHPHDARSDGFPTDPRQSEIEWLQPMACCFCGTPIPDVLQQNNPEPLVPFEKGRCCSDCNATRVIPARLAELDPYDGQEIADRIMDES